MMRSLRAALLAVVIVLAFSACGSTTDEISPSAATELEEDVAEVRAAVEAGDVARARDLLGTLRSTVVQLTTTGGITGDRALAINGVPRAPDATALLARMFPIAYRWFITNPSRTPFRSHAASMSSASSTVRASGFSHRTCFPASAAAITTSWCR